ncbi:hypothetical protein [Methylocystis parvus]|uniref:hypothetical protein n=1 Tax=Methylocystis parvus TaxID=134 RepID=UPI003C75C34E
MTPPLKLLAAAGLSLFVTQAKAAPKTLPPGVVACNLGAWSNDADPKGLNVRAEASTEAAILGVAPPPHKFPDDTYKSEFSIVGYRDGWFLIEEILPPGKGYVDTPYPRSAPQPYRGRGWVKATMVGAAYATSGLPPGRLYDAPRADAASHRAKAREGDDGVAVGDSPKALLGCSGDWALVETQAGERGWVKALCSNQVTNCN